jgi:hypothetical protein
MNNLSTAARLGRLTGITYHETAKVVRLIDWAEVGAIVLNMTVALVVCTYVVGELTGRAVHRANDRLAALWVRLWVPDDCAASFRHQPDTAAPRGLCPMPEQSGIHADPRPMATTHSAAEVLASTPDQPIQATPVTEIPVTVPDSAVVTVELARQMMAQGLSQRAVSRKLAIPRTTLRRMLSRA